MSRNPHDFSRRQFVKGIGALAGGAALSSTLGVTGPLSAGDKRAVTVPKSTLGRTGEDVSKLGIGCVPFKRPHVSPDDVGRTLRRALELGVNYVDVAPNYGNEKDGFSETKMGPTIKEIRDRVFLVTKTEEQTYEGTWNLLRQSMRRLQTDYFDLVHLHNFGNEERFPDLDLLFSKEGALGALLEAQEQGVVRFIGASGHLHPSRFHAALATGKIDVLMNAVNFVCQHTYDFENKVWSRARQENLGLVAMKVLGGGGQGGKGFRLPEDLYDKAIRYALSLPGLSVSVIGVENVSELEKAAETVANANPLSETELHDLAKIGLELAGTQDWVASYGKPVT
jgi:aryl-alcohol dehydrogenase-like predicted oxidoreductase